MTGNVLLTSEFDLDLGVRYVLSERATGKILDSGRIDGQTSFFVGNDVQQDERQAIPLAAQQLAVRLVSHHHGRVLRKAKAEGRKLCHPERCASP